MEAFKLFDVLPFSVFIYLFYIPPAWLLPLTCHFRIYLLLFLIFYSVYLFFPEQRFPSLVLLMHLTVFLASITKGYLGLIGWYLMGVCNFLGSAVLSMFTGLLKSFLRIDFGEDNLSPVDSLKRSGLKKGGCNNGDVISSCFGDSDCGHQTQGPPSELTLITTSNGDPRSEFERPFLAKPVRRQKPDSQRVEKLLLKTLQRRGLFVQWDTPKHSHPSLPITNLSHQFPGISSTKVLSLKALEKAPFPAPLLSHTPIVTINPLVQLSEDLRETIAAETTLSQDITVTETFIPSASIPSSNEASTGTGHVVQKLSLPLLPTASISSSNEVSTDTEHIIQTPSSPLLPTISISPTDEISTGMEHVAQTPSSSLLPTISIPSFGEASAGTKHVVQTSSSLFPQTASVFPSDEASTGTEHVTQTSSSSFLPTTSLSPFDEASTGTENVAQTLSSPFLPTTSASPSDGASTGVEHVAQTPSSPFPPTNSLSPSNETYTDTEHMVQTPSPPLLLTISVSVPNEPSAGAEHVVQTPLPLFLLTAAVANEDNDLRFPATNDLIESPIVEGVPVGCLEQDEVMITDIEINLTKDVQHIARHKAKKTAHCKPVRITRECAEFGHHDRRINRVLGNRFEGSTRCDRSITRTVLRPEGEQERMEIEVDDTLGGVTEDTTSMDWHSSAMQVITMPHQPTRDTTLPQIHRSRLVANGEEEMGDAGDLMDVVPDTMASQVKRRIMADEYEVEPTQTICRVEPGPSRRIAHIGHSRCVQTSTWTNWGDESPKASLDKATSPDEPIKRSKEHNVKVQDLELLGHENLNPLGMKLQRLHNANLSRGDKNLLGELDERKRLREERMAKMAEKDRKRDEAMAAERLAKGPEIRGLAALMAAKKGGARRR